ncbi:MAG: ankyrin repeat domain-containing protein [Fimbriimonadaceae bacterium]|nr:ankyrin repeat domain-containing protein [Fimbriimonadaceae bacterium]
MIEHKAMMDAARKGDLDAIARCAAEDPASVDAVNEQGLPVVLAAAYHGHRSAVEKLIELGAKLDFWTACAVGHLDTVTRLAPDHYAELSPDGFTPLCLAVAFGHPEVAKALIEAGADPNQRSEALGGVAPLHSAVFGRNLECLRVVLDAGAEVDAPQEGGFTALHGAAQNGHREAARLLIDRGADPKRPTERGQTATDIAAEHPELKAFLLDHGG